VRTGSESNGLLGQFDRILMILNSEGSRVKKGEIMKVVGGKGECGDDVVRLLARDRRNLDFLSAKKESKLSASGMPGEKKGN